MKILFFSIYFFLAGVSCAQELKGSSLKLGPAGVNITQDTDGAVTFAGLGNGSDEAFTFNLDDTANTISISSSTGVTLFDFGNIGLTAGTVTVTTANITNAVLLENASVALDPALSADGKYTGTTISGTAGAALAFGDIVYLAAADSRWELVDADAAGTSGNVLVGAVVLAAAADGDPTTILLSGNIRADTAFPSFTISAPAYISATAGDATGTAPATTGQIVRRLGFALTADALYFNPSMDYGTAP